MIALALLVVLPPRAAAQAAGDAGSADEAEQHYRNGIRLRTLREDAAALQEFRHSYQLSPTPRALAQIGIAEQALGLWVNAESHLLEAMLSVTDAWIVKNKPTLDTSLGHIQDRLASIEISGGVAGAQVWINNQDVGKLPLDKPVRVVAGTVTLAVMAAGFFPLKRSLFVAPRSLSREAVSLVPEGQGPPGTAPQSSGQAGSASVPPPRPVVDAPAGQHLDSRALGAWVTLGAAAVALGAGVAFQLVREGRISDFNANANCTVVDGQVMGDGDCQDDYDSAATAQTKAIIGFAAAGVLGATSLVLFLSGQPARAGTNTAGRSGLRCGPGPGELGLACAARF